MELNYFDATEIQVVDLIKSTHSQLRTSFESIDNFSIFDARSRQANKCFYRLYSAVRDISQTEDMVETENLNAKVVLPDHYPYRSNIPALIASFAIEHTEYREIADKIYGDVSIEEIRFITKKYIDGARPLYVRSRTQKYQWVASPGESQIIPGELSVGDEVPVNNANALGLTLRLGVSSLQSK